MGKPYRECKFCGAHLDAGEICDCRKPKREPQAAEGAPRRMRLVAICREVDPETGKVAVLSGMRGNERRNGFFLAELGAEQPRISVFHPCFRPLGAVRGGYRPSILKRRTVTAADVDRIGGIVEL